MNRCSLDFEGIALKVENGLYRLCIGNSSVGFESGCVFMPSANRFNATGSIMYRTIFYEQVCVIT